jgi:hypothetical protein
VYQAVDYKTLQYGELCRAERSLLPANGAWWVSVECRCCIPVKKRVERKVFSSSFAVVSNTELLVFYLRSLLNTMPKAIKYAERTLTFAAQGAWTIFEKLNSIKPNASFTPKWSDKPLLKSYQKEKPPLGTHDRFALPEMCTRDPPADY